MFRNILINSFILCLFAQISIAQNLDVLLDKLAQKDDLSVHTKKETAGYLTVFTRQDLDRMKIKSFKELIEKIPSLRYNENSSGLSAPLYRPYQPNAPSNIRIFVNDRELISPLFGNGLQLFGQLDMAYIDHIEVYSGLPSYEISIEPSYIVVKAYTKTGKRENTSLVGVSGATYGTTDTYVYKSEQLKNFSYFLYADNRNLNREKLHHLGSTISRDKQINNIYAQITMPTSRFEFQAIKAYLDNFIGTSWNITPEDPTTDLQYIYAGYSYTSLDKSLKGYINYANEKNKHYDSSYSPIGLYATMLPPFFATYKTLAFDMREQMLDTKITKKYNFNKSSYLFGLSNRLKKFNFDSQKLDGKDVPIDLRYSSEDIVSLFGEADYHLNDKNRLILSLSNHTYIENGDVKNENISSTRLGHIFHDGKYTIKSFLFYGKFRPTPFELLTTKNLNSEVAYALSSKLLWKHDNIKASLLGYMANVKNSIFYNLSSYVNSKDKINVDSISFKYSYGFSDIDKVEFNSWVLFEDSGKHAKDRYGTLYGGYIALFKKLGKIDTYNSLSYRGGYSNKTGWNYNVTLNYPYSKKLSFYVKGENLLKDALKTDYMRINPLTSQVTKLDNVSVFDRTIWVGMEYKF